MPAVSVIIPAYNSAATIGEALASVAAQSFLTTDYRQGIGAAERASHIDDVEIIVVDDASTDETTSIVEAFIQQSSARHIRLLRHPVNGGPAAARNRGIAEAQGEWIAFLDADDRWLPDRLEVQMKLAEEHPEVALWCGATMPFMKKPEAGIQAPGDSLASGGRQSFGAAAARDCRPPVGTGHMNPMVSQTGIEYPPGGAGYRLLRLEEFASRNPVATSTVLVRREALKAAGGFDPQFRGPEDYDLWMRIAALPSPMASVTRALAFYRHRPGSLSMDDRRFLPEVKRVLAKAFGQGGALAGYPHLRKQALATQYGHASWMAFQRGSRGRALYLLCRAILQDHRVGKQRLGWLYRYVFGASDG